MMEAEALHPTPRADDTQRLLRSQHKPQAVAAAVLSPAWPEDRAGTDLT